MLLRSRNIAMIAMVGMLGFALTGCEGDRPENPKNVAKSVVGEQASRTVMLVDNHGNNVYYFASTGTRFGNSLSLFLKEHPDLKVSAMTANAIDAGRGVLSDRGYFVVFEPKDAPK